MTVRDFEDESAAAYLVLHEKGGKERRDVVVRRIEHPQSRLSDFYRELGDVFGVGFPPHNRWAGFKSLRSRWNEHISTTLMRPVLIIDEAQEVLSSVFAELRALTSKDFDARFLLCIVFAGDGRLTERLRDPDMLPIGSRIRRRLVLEHASRDELCACLDHRLDAAGNPGLLSTELKCHPRGARRRQLPRHDDIGDELLDEKLYFDIFQPAQKPARHAPKKRPA
jgi:general secretion pathway protein A